MNNVALFLGHHHAARVVLALQNGAQGFVDLKRALAEDGGPPPSPSALSKTLKVLIGAKVVDKTDDKRYTLATEDSRPAQIARIACQMEAMPAS